MRIDNIAFLLRVHRRHKWLPTIIRQLGSLAKGRRSHLIVRLDRPSPEVIGTLDRTVNDAPFNDVTFIPATTATRGEGFQNWASSCVDLHEAMKGLDEFDAAMLVDDDVLFTRSSLAELRRHLDFFTHDRVEARWAMCFGDKQTEDKNFPDHWAATAFRVYPDDSWSTERVQHAPAHAADSPRVGRLRSPLLHMGYLTDEDREEAWEAAKSSGKIDAHTMALIKEPSLVPIA